MPITLKTLATDTRTLPPIPVGEGTLTITYKRPTPKYIDEVTARLKAGEAGGVTESVAAQFLDLLADWDFYKDEAQTEKMPFDKESLAQLPYEVLQAALLAIMDAEKPASPNA